MLATIAVALAAAAGCAAPAQDTASLCSDATQVAILPPQLDEASGVVLSRRHPGVLWLHNDAEGTPSLYALDSRGALIAELELPAAGAQFDWEDIALGPCPTGECLYIGDIGDNYHSRDDRAILRLPEPDPRSRSPLRQIERFPIQYPDGPRDSEALFVTPDTIIYIISKGRSGAVTVYRYPPPLRPGERVMVERVQHLSEGLEQLPDLVTGADATSDGRFVAVRTYSHLQLYRLQGDTLAAVWQDRGFDLVALAEPQGEGVALSDDGTVYLVSETGIDQRPAPFSRLRCTLP